MNTAVQNRLRAKAQKIESLLTSAYGERKWSAENYIDDLVGALIATILSQNTSDINSGRAYASLKAAFPGGWETVRTAAVEDVANAIRVGGLANVKAPRIQTVLDAIYEKFGKTSLDEIRLWDDDAIKKLLLSFPGVGIKTVSCVLMFNMGRSALPVDTHVHRVSKRTGLIGEKVSADKAHDVLIRLVDADQTYSFHVHLIEHGRNCCHSQKPSCYMCSIKNECDWYINSHISEKKYGK